MRKRVFTRALSLMLVAALLLASPVFAQAADGFAEAYSRFVGQWSYTEANGDYVSLNIRGVDSQGRVSVSIEAGYPRRVAQYSGTTEAIESNQAHFSYKDSWGNRGNGTLTFRPDGVTLVTTETHRDPSAMYSLSFMPQGVLLTKSGFVPGPILLPYPGTPFCDIAGHWGKEVIKWAYEHSLFSGVSDNAFGPEQTMARGMLVTVLHRWAGTPAAAGSVSFQDVKGDEYYADAVAWASGTGIVKGTGDGTSFSPLANVTREQLAVILYGYAQQAGKDTSCDAAALAGFSDAGLVSDWALIPMQWAATHGVLKGSNGLLNPKEVATRAQVAQIFYNCRDLLA